MPTPRRFALLLLLPLLCISTGCGDPPLHSVSGKVTLGGKPYERLIVYFRPIEREVTPFNLGVGETDAAGVLALNSAAGDGIAAGKYRISFSCIVTAGGAAMGASGDKADDNRRVATKELVRPPYSDDDASPVEFEVQAGQSNEFVFDIPRK